MKSTAVIINFKFISGLHHSCSKKLQTQKIQSKLVTMPGKGRDCGMNQSDSEKIVLDGITNWVEQYD